MPSAPGTSREVEVIDASLDERHPGVSRRCSMLPPPVEVVVITSWFDKVSARFEPMKPALPVTM